MVICSLTYMHYLHAYITFYCSINWFWFQSKVVIATAVLCLFSRENRLTVKKVTFCFSCPRSNILYIHYIEPLWINMPEDRLHAQTEWHIIKNALQILYKLKYSNLDASVLWSSAFTSDDNWRRPESSTAVRLDLVLCFVLAEAWKGTVLLSVSSEVDMAESALRKMSSGGGTGSTTGTELTEHLLRSTTSIGPLMLFMWIWYSAGLFRTWKKMFAKNKAFHLN